MSIPVSLAADSKATAAVPAREAIRPPPDSAPPASVAADEAAVSASLSVSISSGNDPLALLYKTVISSINDQLRSQFGEEAIDNALVHDDSAQGTANRIVALSTAFYDAYRKQYASQAGAAPLTQYLDKVGQGVERGVDEARAILGSLDALPPLVADQIGQTHALVQQALGDFASLQAAPAAFVA